jgi:putative DNA primase/helicase
VTLDPRNIAAIFGGEVTGSDSVNVPGPGHGPHDRSLSIKINPQAPGGFVVYSHAGDNPLACRDFVRERLGLEGWKPGSKGPRIPFVVSDAGPDRSKERNKLFALDLWAQSVDPVGTLVERYLREYRGLALSPDISGSVIRFHAPLYFDAKTRLPAMVCLLRNIKTDEPCGIHRTFLDRYSGDKIHRKMFGIAKEAAVKIDAQGSVSTVLTIGEGVETTLASRMAGYGPVWAVGSSGGVRGFPVLGYLDELTILEENDPTSRRDADACARRYLNSGKPVNIITSHVGNDFNDAWRAMK